MLINKNSQRRKKGKKKTLEFSDNSNKYVFLRVSGLAT